MDAELCEDKFVHVFTHVRTCECGKVRGPEGVQEGNTNMRGRVGEKCGRGCIHYHI